MVERGFGCGVGMLFSLLLLFFIGTLSPNVSDNLQETPSLITSPYTILATATPDIGAGGNYFVVQNNSVIYAYTETINCQYVLAGYVTLLDSDVALSQDIVVNIHTASGDTSTRGIGMGMENVFSWNIVLGHVARAYYISLERASDGLILSPEVRVETEDCDHTLFIVNFEQVAEIP